MSNVVRREKRENLAGKFREKRDTAGNGKNGKYIIIYFPFDIPGIFPLPSRWSGRVG
jgi:hypothetical protein